MEKLKNLFKNFTTIHYVGLGLGILLLYFTVIDKGSPISLFSSSSDGVEVIPQTLLQ